MTSSRSFDVAKVPAVTFGFWLVKILATTFGETAGDTVSMSWLGEASSAAGKGGYNGYVVGSLIFGVLLAALVWLQIRAKRFHPALYWATIIASTTAGTTMADFATRSLGIGYPGGSILLFSLVMASLFIWYKQTGSINVANLHDSKSELYYWITITFSQTLGTALGDWVADGSLGYLGSAAIFGGLLAVLAIAYFATSFNRIALFWMAFIMTRPLGAVVGDYLDKPVANGGLELSRAGASAVLIAAIIFLILIVHRNVSSPHQPTRNREA